MSDATGKVAVYDWGADGLKRKVSIANDPTAGFTYLGSVAYKPNGASSYAIESVAFPEGRFVKTSSGYEVQYQLKDHLGSVRATMNQNGVLSNQSDYYPFGERWSASGEATTNRYLFSGKEKQTAGNLQGMNLLDFGARMYDPEIPRWLTNDPLAEKYYQHSPYLYCAGNPVVNIDPNGMDWYETSDGRSIWRDSQDPKYVNGDNTVWRNVGVAQSTLESDGSYTNSFQNVSFHSKSEFNALAYILNNGLEKDYLSKSSKLSGQGKIDLFQALIRNSAGKFITSQPVQIGVDVYLFVATGGVESLISLGGVMSGVGKATKALVPLGKGSTGRATAANLSEQLALKEIVSDPASGRVIIENMSDASGRWHGWSKMSNKTAHGIEIHYNALWQNGAITKIDDFKFIPKK